MKKFDKWYSFCKEKANQGIHPPWANLNNFKEVCVKDPKAISFRCMHSLWYKSLLSYFTQPITYKISFYETLSNHTYFVTIYGKSINQISIIIWQKMFSGQKQ